jgi:Fic family protein
MQWSWQQAEWPEFTWNAPRLVQAEAHFLHSAGQFSGTVRFLPPDDLAALTIEAISTEALTTSAIEGEILDRDSVQSSIRRQFGFASDNRRVKPAEKGVAELMVDLYRNFAAPLTAEILCNWHRMLFIGRTDLDDIGCYRRNESPMQVISGPAHVPIVHFEAPPTGSVKAEMARFIDWFNRTGPGGVSPLPILTRAAITHLYFVLIHPFEDGNGRIARALAEKALAQGLGQPTLLALAATILLRRVSYYAALEVANKTMDITDWIVWHATMTIESQRYIQAAVEHLLDKTKLLDRLRGLLNERQLKALLRVLDAGPQGFTGGLSAKNYATITKAPPATTTRDLVDMVAKGALRREGERRHARYYPAIPEHQVHAPIIAENGDLIEQPYCTRL